MTESKYTITGCYKKMWNWFHIIIIKLRLSILPCTYSKGRAGIWRQSLQWYIQDMAGKLKQKLISVMW